MMIYETFKQKREYYNLQFIETEDELEFFLKNTKKDSIWRGLSNAEYMIYSSLQREWQKSSLPSTKEKQYEYISKSIHHIATWNNRFFNRYFRNMGLKKGPTILSLLSILRHYEVPSPLIDFTRDINVGLFFAATDYKKQSTQNEVNDYFSLIEIPVEHFLNNIDPKEKILKRFEETKKESLQKLMKENCDTDSVTKYNELLIGNFQEFISTPQWFDFWYFKLNNPPERIEDKEDDLIYYYTNTNPKITNQHGLFIINLDPIIPLEQSFVKPLNAILEMHENEFGDFRLTEEMIPKFNAYEINSRLKEYIVKKLEGSGYTNEFIYPDYETFKRELKPIEKIVSA